ncbi:hypothetical protein HanPI659440_Chr04g0181901 [Helianthus annuus]|nr:hypothetical protein HanPI659440_Chr04g0181901 [Helianthus annuus]
MFITNKTRMFASIKNRMLYSNRVCIIRKETLYTTLSLSLSLYIYIYRVKFP